MITHARGPPDTFEALVFIANVVLGLAFVGGLAFGSVRKHFAQKKPRWDALRGSIHFVSVELTIGAVALAAPIAWLLAPFATTIA